MCCETNNSNGNFTYVRYATDDNGTNFSKNRYSVGLERCFQAVFVSDIELDVNDSLFINYFQGIWYDICTLGDQNNFSRVIKVMQSQLSGDGSIEDQIAEYVNGLNYDKKATDADVWVEYDDEKEPVRLTPFNVSNRFENPCDPQLFPVSTVAYHNGVGVLPAIGDAIFTDAAGTNPLIDGSYQVSTEFVRPVIINVRMGINTIFFCR